VSHNRRFATRRVGITSAFGPSRHFPVAKNLRALRAKRTSPSVDHKRLMNSHGLTLGPILSRPTVLQSLPTPISLFALKGRCRRRGSQGRVVDTGNERTHRDHSGNPAFRRPSINSSTFFLGSRAISADIVKAGSISSTRAAASCASASRPRWAKADARQR
jgi:hypothetical protein